jgi:hypothetical protein
VQSYRITLSSPERAAGRFIATVRRAIQQALAEENATSGITQAAIAGALNVNRSVIHRQIMGYDNLTLGTVAGIADVLGRQIEFRLCKSECIGGNHTVGQSTSSAPLAPMKTTTVPSATNIISVAA